MKKILSILAVAAMAFTACTTDITDDVVKNESVEYATPLEFGIDLEVSRAFMDDETTIKFEAGDKVGVYVIPADPSATATKNAEGTISIVNGKPRVGVNVASFAAGDKVLAYYPYHTQNNNKEASAITLQIPEVQVQAVLGKINCKYLPMVSVATDLSAESGGTILFRPVASIMKLNIYSDDAKYQNATIRRIKFSSLKYTDVTGCNYLVGNCPGFDLTTVTANSEITINAAGITTTDAKNDAQIQYPCYAFADYNGDECKVGFTSNEGDFEPVYMILYPGAYGGLQGSNPSKIYIYTDEFGRFDVNVNETHEFGRAVIKPFNINLAKVSPKVGIGVSYIYSHAVKEGTLKEDGKTLAGGHVADQLLNEELIVIGSGSENPNMACAAMDVAFNKKNFNQNIRTFYAQTLDGQHGFRFEFYSAGRNTLKRGDKIKLNLGSIQWFKRPVGDGWEYYATHVSQSNIFKLTPGCKDEIVTKEKHINELTPADLNTDVTLLDTEFVVKDAPYVMGYNTSGVMGSTRDQSATMIQDKNDDALFLLINSKCTWKRNLAQKITVPQGVGSIHGILVNTTDMSYANNGNIGKFQLRPFDETSFDMTATKESAVNEVVSWRMDLQTVSIGKYAWNGRNTPGGFVSTKQTEIANQNKLVGRVNGAWTPSTALYTTNRKIIITHPSPANGEFTSTAHYHNQTYFPTITDGVKNTGANEITASLMNGANPHDNTCGSASTTLAFFQSVVGFYEWNENGDWTGNTNGIIAEFPGAGKDMSISFSMGSMPIVRTETNKTPWVVADNNAYRDRGTTYGFPLYWKVECSTDNGTTWTRCTNAINGENLFKLNPLMRWTSKTELTSPIDNTTTVVATTPDDHCHSYVQQKFVLPASAVGAAKVMVKISPASLRLAWFGSTGKRTYTDTSDVEGFDCTSTYNYIMAMCLEDVVVTTAK